MTRKPPMREDPLDDDWFVYIAVDYAAPIEHAYVARSDVPEALAWLMEQNPRTIRGGIQGPPLLRSAP